MFYYSVSSLYEDGREHLTPYEIKALVFSAGTGEPNEPFQIAMAEQLVSIAEFPDLLDKHFVLANDINLDPNLFGGWVFDQAVIPTFSGTFDGNDHTLSHLTIKGKGSLGRLGLFGELEPGAEVKDLAIEDVNITGSGSFIGGLVGYNYGDLTSCCITGTVSGDEDVGGLVGSNGDWNREGGVLASCYSTGAVSGTGWSVGGLVGRNDGGHVTASYSTGTVSGYGYVGDLVGLNDGHITASYSTGTVTGDEDVGGLVGRNHGSITSCYSTGLATGDEVVGGLVGSNYIGSITTSYSTGTVGGDRYIGGLVGSNSFGGDITTSFWDTQTSGQTTSAGGIGLTTAEMQSILTYQDAGWDLAGDIKDGLHEFWRMPEGDGYPHLTIFSGYTPPQLQGVGTLDTPYLIRNAVELGAMVYYSPYSDYRLTTSIDLSGIRWSMAVIPWFEGTFDGNGHVISNLHIQGRDYLGLFGQLDSGAEISNLGLEAVDVNGTVGYVGGLVGENSGSIATSYSTGTVNGGRYVGGLVGENYGDITTSYSTATVSGDYYVGGLVGGGGNITASYSTGTVTGADNVGGLTGSGGNIITSYSTATVTGADNVGGLAGSGVNITTSYSTGTVSGGRYVGGLTGSGGDITTSYSTATVSGDYYVGGLVGKNSSRGNTSITSSYATGTVNGHDYVGGLVGDNYGDITTSYSTGRVSGNTSVGGLVGYNPGSITTSFWDVETSGLLGSNGGVGLTTAEMMDPEIIGLNGLANDPNWVLDPGKDYPRLAWEGIARQLIRQPLIDWMDGDGTPEMPYQITNADQFIRLSKASALADKHFILINDLDLVGLSWFQAVIPCFSGSFNGNGFCIRHVSIQGEHNLGLIGVLGGGVVTSLGLENISVEGTGGRIGGLVGTNDNGSLNDCYSTGAVSGTDYYVGGLAGYNGGSVTTSYSMGTVNGDNSVGGIVGSNYGSITTSYSTVKVSGDREVGGLGGLNWGSITSSYSTGTVSGNTSVGGLVGFNRDHIITSYSMGVVNGDVRFGGLVGENSQYADISLSFWDVNTSAMSTSAGGIGKTTAEMQTTSTFLDAGWDFVDETANGPNDIWKISEGLDYPRLWWEEFDGRVALVLGQMLTVTLESNPSTGYRWEWVEDQGSILEQIGEAEFKPSETGEPPLVGAGGWEIFRFTAVSTGQMTLRLVYRRPWEEGVEPLKTFSLQVTVP